MPTKSKKQNIDNPEIIPNSIQKEMSDFEKDFGNINEAMSLEKFEACIKKARTDGVVTAKKQLK